MKNDKKNVPVTPAPKEPPRTGYNINGAFIWGPPADQAPKKK